MIKILVENCSMSLPEQLSEDTYANEGDVRLWWFGQAGFLIQYGGTRLLIDPYLSDFLAKKYANAKFKHIRMVPPPITASELSGIKWVLCTHRHSDHMDLESLQVILENNPTSKIVCPRAETSHIAQMAIASKRCLFVNAGDRLPLVDHISLEVLASAHEELKVDINANHHFLGYILECNGIKIYHSGDCVPYEGLTEALRLQKIDVALLPVNGRDDYRRTYNIAGNFTVAEALALCRTAKIPYLIPHHFGMFDFNTVSVSDIRCVCHSDISVYIPELYLTYILRAL
jgi:L-ascorbate metabolism protein UlaG (beta-lactamase superfamily)